MTQLWLSLAVVLWMIVQFEAPAAMILVAERHGKGVKLAVPALMALVALALWRGRPDTALTLGSGVLAALVIWRMLRRGASLWWVVLAALAPVVLANGVQLLASDPARVRADLERGAQVLTASPVQPDSTSAPEAKVLAENYRELAARASRWTLRLLPGGVLAFLLGEVLALVALAGRLGRAVGYDAVPPFSRWAVPFGSVWALALGLGLVATRHGPSVVVGLNIVLVTAAVLATQGLAVLVAFLDRRLPTPARWPLLILAAFVAWPFLVPAAVFLGIADLWVDFRHLGKKVDEQRT